MAAGLPKVDKPMEKKSQLDVSSWRASCNQGTEVPFEHLLSNKNVWYENKLVRKKSYWPQISRKKTDSPTHPMSSFYLCDPWDFGHMLFWQCKSNEAITTKQCNIDYKKHGLRVELGSNPGSSFHWFLWGLPLFHSHLHHKGLSETICAAGTQ